jgi:acetyl esterase
MLDPEIESLMPPASKASANLGQADIQALRKSLGEIGESLPRPDISWADYMADHVPVRLYKPDGAQSSGLPLLLFLHGGAWILGDLESHDAACRLLAAASGCAVLAVGYRLAPEHAFPAGLQDCNSAFDWAIEHTAELGCDPTRIALGGESAGANLAAAAAIYRRDQGQSQPLFQLLVHPATDLTLRQPSIDEIQVGGLTRQFLEHCIAYYAGGTALDVPLVSPLLAKDLSGLPPAMVYTVEVDPLRDDGENYALALAKAGNEVHVQRLLALPHGFMFLPITIASVEAAFRLLGARVADYFRNR